MAGPDPAPSKLRLAASREEALKAVLDALPKDALVREEDDGVGRFAGRRTVVIVPRGRDRLLMFDDTYGAIKTRLDTPQLDVTFAEKKKGLVVRITPEAVKKPTLGSHLSNLVGNVVTVAALVVGYYFVRQLPVDTTIAAIVGVSGGAAWTAIAVFMPKSVDRGLEQLVTRALATLPARGEAAPAGNEAGAVVGKGTTGTGTE